MREFGRFLFHPCEGTASCPVGRPHCPGGREGGRQANRMLLRAQAKPRKHPLLLPCASEALRRSLSKIAPRLQISPHPPSWSHVKILASLWIPGR